MYIYIYSIYLYETYEYITNYENINISYSRRQSPLNKINFEMQNSKQDFIVQLMLK